MLMVAVSFTSFSQGLTCAEATNATLGVNSADNRLGEQWYKYTNNTSADMYIQASTCDVSDADGMDT